MREGILSIGTLVSSDLPNQAERVERKPEIAIVRRPRTWDAEGFAKQQIQNLVRRVFFSNAQSPVRQIVIGGIERETDVDTICVQVAETLAQETSKTIALAGGSAIGHGLQLDPDAHRHNETVPLQRFGMRLSANVWRLPSPCAAGVTTASLHSYLGQIRRQFDYSILELPAIGESHQADAMAEFADGVVFVISAQNTRRATARKVIESLADTRTRILGTVLSDRVFPIPEAIYRRL
jgi:hypothetical protein